MVVSQRTSFPESDDDAAHDRSGRRPTAGAGDDSRAASRVVRGPDHRRERKAIRAAVSPSGYVPIRREWRAGDVVEVRLPMTLRTEPLPGAPEYVAFVYGPDRARRPARHGGRDAGRADHRQRAHVGEHVERGDRRADARWHADMSSCDARARCAASRCRSRRLALGRPRDVKLAPFYKLAHERYNLYWKVQSDMRAGCAIALLALGAAGADAQKRSLASLVTTKAHGRPTTATARSPIRSSTTSSPTPT